MSRDRSSDWRDQALCQHFPRLPWVLEPEDRTPGSVRAMTVVCRSCPVGVECGQYVIDAGIVSGFWAGIDRTPIEAECHARGGAA